MKCCGEIVVGNICPVCGRKYWEENLPLTDRQKTLLLNYAEILMEQDLHVKTAKIVLPEREKSYVD